MKKILTFIICLFLLFSSFKSSFAVYDPLSKPNNKFGIHILFPQELSKAAELVNSSGGDWGYVTIPIQYNDRDLEKWQKFMDDCRQYHLIPILRISTDAYYANTNVWRKPNDYDIVDFVNFLNSLSWPVKNRYVLMYNEINRNDEWGGAAPSPSEYADFLSFAVNVFKSQSNDFFIIAAGLDNASPNDGVKYLDNFVFLQRMGQHNPEVFAKIDGFSSHSYPNPNFAQAPSETGRESTATYKYEEDIITGFAGKKVPIFITETGWNADALPQSVISKYYQIAMTAIWGEDGNVIAVTPFILDSEGGPFDKFSFMKGGQFNDYGKTYQMLAKVKGAPSLNLQPKVLAAATDNHIISDQISFHPVITTSGFSPVLKDYFKMVFMIGK